jgi:hypothetical protein
MKVAVTLVTSSKHPEYLTLLTSAQNGEVIWKFQTRFNSYRDFATFCEKSNPGLMTGTTFPPTHTTSAYGFKLSEAQLSTRRLLLEQVSSAHISLSSCFCHTVVTNFHREI